MSAGMPCKTGEHNFMPVDTRGNYYKRPSGDNAAMDQSISFKMLYCTRCGKGIEVVAQDHRTQPDG